MEHQEAIDRFHKESEETIRRESERIMQIVLKSNYYKYQTNNANKEARFIIEKIKSNNKFIVNRNGTNTEWEITINPSYTPTIRYMIYNGLIAAALSLVAGYIQYQYQSQATILEVEKLSKRIDSVQHRLDSLHTKK